MSTSTAYGQHGIAGPRNGPRSDAVAARRYPDLIEGAVRLRREQLARAGPRRELLKGERRFGRYDAAEPNQRSILDVLVRPWVPL